MSSSSGDDNSPPESGSSEKLPTPPSSTSSSSQDQNSNSGGNGNNSKNNINNGGPSKSDSSIGDSNSKSMPDYGSKDKSSHKKGLHHSSSSHDNENALIAGVAASAALLLLILILLCVCCCRKRRRRSHHKYYGQNPYPHAGNVYYTGGNNWQHNHHARPSPDGMKMSGPPGSGTVGTNSERSWMMPGLPMMSGSDISSGYSAGSPHPGMPMGGYHQGYFTYNDLAMATNGFSQTNLLGQGGFGFVHKGVLPNGKEVAVKCLKSNSGQGEREFQAEVEIISRVHHRHLVSLVGFCIAGAQRMLVYEFVPNGSLESHLYGAGQPPMDWPTRLKIALGAAKGFAYLHEDCNPRIIHRDIKTANILLDMKYEAKVADFGLAKLSSDASTHVSTRIMGTFGYLAPEYASSGKLTEKSDVYSFGVMLLELITGRRPIDLTRDDDDDTLVDWAKPLLMRILEQDGSLDELVDPRLHNNYNHQDMLRMIHCAAASVKQSARRRPKMSKLVRTLEGDVPLEALNEGMKATQGVIASNGSDYNSRMGSSNTSSSQDFSSDEQPPNTAEYAHSATTPPNLPRPGL